MNGLIERLCAALTELEDISGNLLSGQFSDPSILQGINDKADLTSAYESIEKAITFIDKAIGELTQ